MTHRRPRILAIDDTPANLLTLGAALSKDFDLQMATSGQQGLALAVESPPDLILLDVMMPEMDGYETCRRFKADPQLRTIPVIFITALIEVEAETTGLALGAADYLTKPLNVEIARHRIRNLLEREQLRKTIEEERNLLEQRVAERTAELAAVAGAREQALAAAERLSALKSQFINNMSHELRTPLNHVIGLSVLCQRTRDLEKAKDLAIKIHAAGEQLLGIVNGVLDFSAVESGHIKVRREPVDLSSMLETLAEKYAEKARAKGLTFEMQLPENLPSPISGDRKRLQQVLEELLGNALKFTVQGKVTLAVHLYPDHLAFAITDSGIGMTPQQLEAGFKPFQQADGSATRRFGGLGLGLALTEHLVTLMGGELSVESRAGEGTTFRLTLPQNKITEQQESPLHAQLRAATKLPHHALDHHPLLAPLIRANPQVEDYANALAALHGIYALAETAIAAFLAPQPALFDYAPRRRLAALEADLAALGKTPVATGASLPAPRNIGELVGMLYTIEGSARGGRFICRHLQQHLGDAVPLSFFAGDGDASEQRWDEFWQFADSRCPQEEYPDAARSAVELFEFIKTHLDRCNTNAA